MTTSDQNPAPNGIIRGWPDDGYAIQTREIAKDVPTTKSPLTGRIQAIGPSVAVRVNGALVSEAEVGRPSGHIGLQGETGVVEFKNISVREITTP